MMEICKRKNINSYKMIQNCLNNDIVSGMQPRDICLNKDESHTKFMIYRSVMNVDLSVHPVYRKGCSVPDYQRVAFSRLRLTSHSLISEKGRWSRTRSDKRACPCDGRSVQDEHHALLACPRTSDIRRRYTSTLHIHPELTVKDLMKHKNVTSLCQFIYNCMKIFNS